MPSYFEKDPSAILDYQVNWTDWLTTDTIASSTWTVPDGITKVTDVTDDTKATIWLSGGTVGKRYTITNRIVTAGGRQDERSITIKIVNK